MPAKPPRPAARAPKVVLWEMRLSHHCIKAEKLLDAKGIAYEHKDVPYHDKRELLQASGQDYVPWLQWDGQGVPWHQVVDFVEAKVPQPSAFPPGLRGQARILEQWAHDIVEEMVWRYVLPEVPATFRDEHERWVFEELQIRKRGPLEAYQQQQAKHLDAMKATLAPAEVALGDHDFMLGEAPSLADFALFGALCPLGWVGKDVPKDLPRLRAWHQRVAKV